MLSKYCLKKLGKIFLEKCHVPSRLNMFFLKNELVQILQPGNWLNHGEGAKSICFRGFHMVGNSVLECFQGRILQEIGKCLPSIINLLK